MWKPYSENSFISFTNIVLSCYPWGEDQETRVLCAVFVICFETLRRYEIQQYKPLLFNNSTSDLRYVSVLANTDVAVNLQTGYTLWDNRNPGTVTGLRVWTPDSALAGPARRLGVREGRAAIAIWWLAPSVPHRSACSKATLRQRWKRFLRSIPSKYNRRENVTIIMFKGIGECNWNLCAGSTYAVLESPLSDKNQSYKINKSVTVFCSSFHW